MFYRGFRERHKQMTSSYVHLPTLGESGIKCDHKNKPCTERGDNVAKLFGPVDSRTN